MNYSKVEQLSKLDDGDEDIDFPNSCDSVIKRTVHLIVSSFTLRIFGVLLNFVDLSLIITDLIATDNTMYILLGFHSISLVNALVFFNGCSSLSLCKRDNDLIFLIHLTR